MAKPLPTTARERFLEALLKSATDHAIVGTDLNGMITVWNEGAVRILGWSEAEMLGQRADIFFTPEDRAASVPQLEMKDAIAEGHSTDERWHLRKDGSRFWGSGEMTPLMEDGQLQGFLKIVLDRTEARLAAERQKVLARELSHRMKNTLAIVQSIAARIFREGVPLKEARGRFDTRIAALGKAQDVLLNGEWLAADLEAVVYNAVSPIVKPERSRLRVAGVKASIGPSAAVSFTLVLHELATNAVKYGAFSVPGGHVKVSWKITGADTMEGDGRRLVFRWSEHDGPKVAPPDRAGLGTALIQSVFQRHRDEDKVALAYPPEGLRFDLDLLLSDLKGHSPDVGLDSMGRGTGAHERGSNE